jgi:hypothetical protein
MVRFAYKGSQAEAPLSQEYGLRLVISVALIRSIQTHPVGFERPASLQAPLAGPEGKST